MIKLKNLLHENTISENLGITHNYFLWDNVGTVKFEILDESAIGIRFRSIEKYKVNEPIF